MRCLGMLLTVSLGAVIGGSPAGDLCAQEWILGPAYALENGDTNGDWERDLSDPMYLMSHLFLGGPSPVPLALCGTESPAVQNGDANGDEQLDLSDGVHLLTWLFSGGPSPVGACSLSEGLGAARNPNPRVIPPNARAHGKTYGDWGAAWWQWALSVPAAENPVVDSTGEFCDVNQSGPVWFLAGNFGGETERSCTVPAGKTIFFPLLNFTLWAPEDLEFLESVGVTGDTPFDILLTGSMTLVDAATSLSLSVDGVELENLFDYRGASSEAFAIELSDLLEPDFPAGTRDPAASDGYWIMLAPLTPGEHEIVFSGSLSCTGDNCFGLVFDFALEVTYHLTVE